MSLNLDFESSAWVSDVEVQASPKARSRQQGTEEWCVWDNPECDLSGKETDCATFSERGEEESPPSEVEAEY